MDNDKTTQHNNVKASIIINIIVCICNKIRSIIPCSVHVRTLKNDRTVCTYIVLISKVFIYTTARFIKSYRNPGNEIHWISVRFNEMGDTLICVKGKFRLS